MGRVHEGAKNMCGQVIEEVRAMHVQAITD